MIKIIQNNKEGFSIIPKVQKIKKKDNYTKTYYITFSNIKRSDIDYSWLDSLFKKIFESKEFINKNIDQKAFLKCIHGDATPFTIIKMKKNTPKINITTSTSESESETSKKKSKQDKTELIRQKLAEKKVNKNVNKNNNNKNKNENINRIPAEVVTPINKNRNNIRVDDEVDVMDYD